MSLFQQSVLNKYLKTLNQEEINLAWDKFTSHFHNLEIQENIRNSKEEQYQEGFLRDLFVNIFGYTLNPESNFNLTTELKNVKGAKKTDGAVLQNDKALAVIELKGTNTVDLAKVETQAFGYKNNQPDCIYVITSNFEKLRFYIDNAIDFEEFNLFLLNKAEFDLLWLCLSANSLLKNIPKQIKEESLTHEEKIGKKLYKDYSQFRNEIFNNIQENNPQYDKLLLFKKTQKLLDRFLFIFFAEDRGLLPPNSIRKILKQWIKLKDKYDAYVPLYKRFKMYFGYLNTGHVGQEHEVFAYNGGLFAPDDMLDNIKIDDKLLYEHTLNLSNYDFESEVSVNILGHIFEHSLTEIENIQAKIQGIEIDKSKTKRKKDGVFYTPKYITKYIVDNTVGKLCEEKKSELDIQETEYEKGGKGRRKTTLEMLQSKLDKYREWLLKLSVCDPACGSGAFLVQALEFLMAEHNFIDELQAKIRGGIVMPYVVTDILENNLYGVDINEESVEIAKLSLWLHTAEKGRKLTTLSNNLKCGNSLISNPEVAGDKTFNWQKEFSNIFTPKDKQAFHIVLTTHNSRTSERMIEYKVQKGEMIELDLEHEIELTKIISEIVEEQEYKCLAYNICKDHVHMVLVCEYEELATIVKTIKGKSSYLYQSKGFKPLGTPLWSQKFFRAELDDWQESTKLQETGYKYKDSYLENTLDYILHNRKKHELPKSKKLQSIIDGFIVLEEKAFEVEYGGGFDVVIGNPPYLRIQGLKDAYPELTKYYEENYISATGNYDIYVLFLEKSFQLINNNGISSYIMPHKFLITDFGIGIRKFLKKNTAVDEIVHFGSEIVFQDASTYTCIINTSKSKKEELYFKKVKPSQIFDNIDFERMNYGHLSENNWDLQSESIFKLIEKLKQQPYTVSDVFDKIFQGIATSLDAVYVFKGQDKGDFIEGYNEKYAYHFEIEKELVKPFIKGNQLSRYSKPRIKYFVLFPYQLSEKDATSFTEKYIKDNYPKAYSYLKHFEKEIRGRERGRMDIEEGWFLYIYPKNLSKFHYPKIMTQEISKGCNMTFDEKGIYYHPTTIYSFVKKPEFQIEDKYYLGILNSNLMWFFLKNTGTELRGGFFRFKTNYLKPFPLPKISINANVIITKVNKQLSDNQQLQTKTNKFLHRTKDNLFSRGLNPLKDVKMSKKLTSFYDYDFKSFVSELKKKKIILSLTQQDEWEEYFNRYKSEINQIQVEIDKTDNEINQMVYELYGLTDEEIRIVEEASI